MANSSPTQSNSRERRYNRFFQLVEQVVEEIQAHHWAKTGEPKRRLKGEQLERLGASIETLIRDSVAVVYQRSMSMPDMCCP